MTMKRKFMLVLSGVLGGYELSKGDNPLRETGTRLLEVTTPEQEEAVKMALVRADESLLDALACEEYEWLYLPKPQEPQVFLEQARNPEYLAEVEHSYALEQTAYERRQEEVVHLLSWLKGKSTRVLSPDLLDLLFEKVTQDGYGQSTVYYFEETLPSAVRPAARFLSGGAE